MTDDEAGALIEEHEGRIIAMYEQGLGHVAEPVITVTLQKDGSLLIKGHEREKLLSQLSKKSKFHGIITPCERGEFWCLIIEAKTGGQISTHKMQHVALTAPGTEGLH